MTPSLPSFIQLMASLGLDNDNSKPNLTATRSRSSSLSSRGSTSLAYSPSSSHLNISSDAIPRDVDTDRRYRLRTLRFSPYISQSSSARQSSATSVELEADNGRRSTSPRLSSSPARNRPSPLLKASRELHATTPISSYARRRTPQNSPTTAAFPHRVHADRPDTIILPSLLPAPISH